MLTPQPPPISNLRVLFAGSLVALVGCIGPSTAPELNLALHGEWSVDPDSLCEHLGCKPNAVDEIREVFAQVGGVVEITDVAPTTFRVKGLAEAETLVTVGLDDGHDVVERYAQMIVRPVSRFDFSPRCAVSEPSTDPWLVPGDSELYVRWGLSDLDGHRLLGDPNFDFSKLQASELDVARRDVTLTVPQTAGSYDITSPLVDQPVATVEVYEPEDFNGLEIEWWPETPVKVQEARNLWTGMLVNGQRACQDRVVRVADVLTPETCSLGSASLILTIEQDHPDFLVYGLADGVCTIQVTTPEHGFSETTSIDIYGLDADA